MSDQLLLAQIPTITPVSRQALVSGLRPADFASTLFDNGAEPNRWVAFWSQQDLPRTASAYLRLRLGREGEPSEIGDPRLQALCLVDDSIDEMVHSAVLGTADFLGSLRLWLDRRDGGQLLEAVIVDLLDRGYTVYLTSDHGHTEARGIGQPSGGLVVQTGSKRARLYTDRRIAQAAQAAYPGTEVRGMDGLLPPDVWALMPGARGAFAPVREVVVTHGGITLDEACVPLVTIKQG